MLMSFNELNKHGSVLSGLGKVWFIFAWATVVPLLAVYLLKGRSVSYDSRTEQIVKGWWISLNAGVFEELTFRVFLFLAAMVIEPWVNVITFGLERWLTVNVEVPVANWATLHALQPQFTAHPNWVFAGAIITASVWFRNGHKYLGPIGYINSWFIGMVMFYLVFNYGLVTAIVAHFVYDAIIFTIGGLTSERAIPARRAFGRSLGRQRYT
jgi:hypothetical protein